MKFKIHRQIKGKEIGSNRFYAGVHWRVRSEIVKEWHDLVYYSMLEQKIPKKLFTKPVSITIRVKSKLDIDNHCFMAKVVIDGLKGYLIEDDSKNYVQVLTIAFHDKRYIEVEVNEL